MQNNALELVMDMCERNPIQFVSRRTVAVLLRPKGKDSSKLVGDWHDKWRILELCK